MPSSFVSTNSIAPPSIWSNFASVPQFVTLRTSPMSLAFSLLPNMLLPISIAEFARATLACAAFSMAALAAFPARFRFTVSCASCMKLSMRRFLIARYARCSVDAARTRSRWARITTAKRLRR